MAAAVDLLGNICSGPWECMCLYASIVFTASPIGEFVLSNFLRTCSQMFRKGGQQQPLNSIIDESINSVSAALWRSERLSDVIETGIWPK